MLCGHLLVDTVLQTLIVEDMVESSLITEEIIERLASFESGDDITEEYQRIFEQFQAERSKLKCSQSENETAKFWINYMEYIGIVKRYIKAERTGNWKLHLSTVKDMLNLFAATGHLHYAKSARFYLQQMCELETSHPDVYHVFSNSGFHAVRRNDRIWSGLWSDLVIEQFMMRAIKTSGGLTRGRGMNESS